MTRQNVYSSDLKVLSRRWNRFDWLLVILVAIVFWGLAQTGSQMALPYALGQPIQISLSPWVLPGYALRTVLRMFIALFFSIFISMLLGTWAAKNQKAEQVIIPAIDVLQAVPVLSFLALTVTGFIHLFPNSLLGPECASIFAIFVSQVWNIIFSFYQSLKMLPSDLKEASAMLQLSPWQKFWKLEVPFATPALLWNMMISMSASWFFVVYSEAISVAHQDILLPGVGSYIAMAIDTRNMTAVFYAIVTMVGVIFLYDQLLFRPLIAWSEKFRMEPREESIHQARWTDWIYQSVIYDDLQGYLIRFRQAFIHARWLNNLFLKKTSIDEFGKYAVNPYLWQGFLGVAVLSCLLSAGLYIYLNHLWSEVSYVSYLGAITAFRVIVLIILSSLLWIPIGIAIGLRGQLAQRMQPVIQFLAAFPANLFYPLFVVVIIKYHLNPEIWLTPLMILGTQWYILFNVIAGALNIPTDFKLLTENFQVRGGLWWRKLALPAILPYFVTGAVTAAGGAWNASILAEFVSWGDVTLVATGLGQYIKAQTIAGDFPKLMLGTMMMCFYVLLFNHLIWRPLYRFTQERFGMQ